MAGKSKPNKKKTGKKTMKNNGKNFDNTTAKTEESRDKGYEKLKVEYETVVVERNFLRDKLVTTTAELEVVKKELANLKSQSILPVRLKLWNGELFVPIDENKSVFLSQNLWKESPFLGFHRVLLSAPIWLAPKSWMAWLPVHSKWSWGVLLHGTFESHPPSCTPKLSNLLVVYIL